MNLHSFIMGTALRRVPHPAVKAAIRELKVSGSTFRLLTPGNPKTNKGNAVGYWTLILHLAPARLSGFNVCPMATQGCRAACLNTAGRGGIAVGGILTEQDVASGARTNAIQDARIRRTKLLFHNRAEFMSTLVADIEKALRMAQAFGYTPCFRLNGTSDIRWEAVACVRNGIAYRNIMSAFHDIQFYDYTKIANRKNLPANYSLTFSLADGNDAQAAIALEHGMNVAAVFRDKTTVARYQASGFMGHPVSNGDETDLRFLDPDNYIIALYAKGNARKDQSGFVRD